MTLKIWSIWTAQKPYVGDVFVVANSQRRAAELLGAGWTLYSFRRYAGSASPETFADVIARGEGVYPR